MVEESNSYSDKISKLKDSADDIDNLFASLSDNIASYLDKAANSGEFSFKKMSNIIKKDLEKTFLNLVVRKPVQNLLNNLFSDNTAGKRASGGYVQSGQGYIVGENGPEYFVPSNSGHIVNDRNNQTNININMSGVKDFNSFKNSQSQMANIIHSAMSKSNRIN